MMPRSPKNAVELFVAVAHVFSVLGDNAWRAVSVAIVMRFDPEWRRRR
jgi:hypothetical protein